MRAEEDRMRGDASAQEVTSQERKKIPPYTFFFLFRSSKHQVIPLTLASGIYIIEFTASKANLVENTLCEPVAHSVLHINQSLEITLGLKEIMEGKF